MSTSHLHTPSQIQEHTCAEIYAPTHDERSEESESLLAGVTIEISLK